MKRKKQPYSRYSKQLKLEAIRRVIEEEQPVQEVIRDLGIRHRDNVYEWVKKYKKCGPQAFDSSFRKSVEIENNNSIEEQLEVLKAEVDALKTYIHIFLQGEEEKYKAIEALEGRYPVDILCNALDVSECEFLAYKERQASINDTAQRKRG